MLRWSTLSGTLALTGCWLLAGAQGALAQSFPVRPIRVVAPFSAGGGADTVARLVAQKL